MFTFGISFIQLFTWMWYVIYFPSKIRFVSSIEFEDVRNMCHCCHVVNLANRETAVSSSALLQSFWRNCVGWVSRLLSKCSRGTLKSHVTVTWRRRRFKSDKFSNRHALLQVSRRSFFTALHEVEHTRLHPPTKPQHILHLIPHLHQRTTPSQVLLVGGVWFGWCLCHRFDLG